MKHLILAGWEKIEEEVGLSRKLLKKLKLEEGFPLTYAGNRPMTSTTLVDDWLFNRIREEQKQLPIRG